MCKNCKEIQQKYEHALDRVFDLFKYGRDREKAMETKLARIKELCECNQTDPFDQLDEILKVVKDDSDGVGIA